MKKMIKNIILFLIQLIEKYEYRHLVLNENDPSKKIIDTIDVDFQKNKIQTDTQDAGIIKIHKTQPYRIYRIITHKGKKIECADHHIVFDKNMKEIFCKDLSPGTEIQTQEGLERVISIQKLRHKVSMFDVSLNDKNHRYYSNGILSHNTVTSAIFIAWYLCFHFDRNVLVVANKQATTSEIVSKIKTILKNLPFFLKPGVISGGVTGMSFDNGCRLLSQATTKTAAIGFTIHLLYADEFAHIHPNFLTPFYRSVYPTLSSSKISRIIISSTPNGLNLFYKIYKGAVEGTNAYHPIRIDWWQVPGRDEDWKQREIANLGSEELFQQEYGNRFLATSTTLLDAKTIEFLSRISTEFKWMPIYQTELGENDYAKLKWHPNFDPNQNWSKEDNFAISVDLADGVGRDYTVFNIFKLEAMSIAKIRKLKTFNEEQDFFRLRQVGLFHSNTDSIEKVSPILEMLIFDIFGADHVIVIMEMNFKGNYLVEKLSKNPEFYPEIFLHTKHTLKATSLSLGIKLNKENKQTYCRELKTLMRDRRIITFEEQTLEELQTFGLDDKGRFSGRGNHDDIAMTCVNLVNYFDSHEFYEQVEDSIDLIDERKRKAIMKKIEDMPNDTEYLDTIRWFGKQG